MQDSNFLFPQEIYSAYLITLNGIKLSKREIDIISCIHNGRSAKGISHLLSITPKTVEAHTYNVMKKLDCPSRESLISLIESSFDLLDQKGSFIGEGYITGFRFSGRRFLRSQECDNTY